MRLFTNETTYFYIFSLIFYIMLSRDEKRSSISLSLEYNKWKKIDLNSIHIYFTSSTSCLPPFKYRVLSNSQKPRINYIYAIYVSLIILEQNCKGANSLLEKLGRRDFIAISNLGNAVLVYSETLFKLY